MMGVDEMVGWETERVLNNLWDKALGERLKKLPNWDNKRHYLLSVI